MVCLCGRGAIFLANTCRETLVNLWTTYVAICFAKNCSCARIVAWFLFGCVTSSNRAISNFLRRNRFSFAVDKLPKYLLNAFVCRTDLFVRSTPLNLYTLTVSCALVWFGRAKKFVTAKRTEFLWFSSRPRISVHSCFEDYFSLWQFNFHRTAAPNHIRNAIKKEKKLDELGAKAFLLRSVENNEYSIIWKFVNSWEHNVSIAFFLLFGTNTYVVKST